MKPHHAPSASTPAPRKQAQVCVDCLGDCATGRGYCYAHPAGLCGSCVLWAPDAAAGEVSCYEYGAISRHLPVISP